jgi:putative peptide maturation system protein
MKVRRDPDMTSLDVLHLRALEIVQDAAASGDPPVLVQRRARELEKTFPTTKLDVFWEVEPFSKKHHYDLLIRTEGAPSLLLRAGPDRGMPWVYRGAFRWNETILLRVNNQQILMQDAVARCDALWAQSSIADRLVNGALVADYLESQGVDAGEVDETELQSTLDAVRCKHGLFTEQATRAWMEARGITMQGLEGIAREVAMGLRVRKQVVDGQEEAYYAKHRPDFERAFIVEVRAGEDAHARVLYEQARETQGGLLGCLGQHAIACLLRGQESFAQPHFRNLWRSPCDPPFAAVFAADAPSLLAPIHYADFFSVVQVLERRPPIMDEATRFEVQSRIFKQWLVMRRREARIEWSWDQAKPT